MESDDQTKQGTTIYTVLVVENDPQSLQFITSILSPYYRLLVMEKAEQVLEHCKVRLPDVILMEIPTQGLSAYDLARQLREDPRTKSVPIIFLTDKTDEEAIDKAFQAGAADYINKPFKGMELLVRVKTQISLNLSKRRLRQAIDLVPHRIFAKDSEHTIILANVAAADFYSLKVDDLLGKKEPPLPKGWVYEVVTNAQCPNEDIPSRMLTCEEHLLLPDGTKKYFLTNKIPFPFSDSQLPAVLEVVIDITEEKRRQEEINHLNEQLLKHGQFKDKLLSLIAHDLINSVFITNSTLTLLLKNAENLPWEKFKEEVEKVKNNSGKTLQLLVNLLEWSKAQFEAVTYEPVTLNLLEELEKLQSILQPYLDSKTMKLECLVPGWLQISADPNMLQTIFRNLVSNAIKYSNEGDTISITAREEEGRVYISITDQGVGIKPEQLKELQQGNLEHVTTFGTKGEKGSGIGLNLSKEFVERHGGTLVITSETGAGSTFTFSVPVAA
jgi:two-component system, sensor histidine kinase and response regulator